MDKKIILVSTPKSENFIYNLYKKYFFINFFHKIQNNDINHDNEIFEKQFKKVKKYRTKLKNKDHYFSGGTGPR